MPFKLDQILRAKEAEVTAAKKARNIGDLKRMSQDAPPLRSFKAALGGEFGVIAEIKRRSPSMGDMRPDNFEQAPAVYARSPIVKAISVITDEASFGMSLDHLLQVKAAAKQPILRKDFIETDYGVHQARAFGADAVLLMAAVLKTRDKCQRLFDLASELGLDVLFEAHSKAEIDIIPDGVKIYGINSRNFMGQWRRATLFGKLLPMRDFSTNLDVFSLIKHLPEDAIKVAESGISPSKISNVISLGYNAALIGTSLLKSADGIQNALAEFERVIAPSSRTAPNLIPVAA
jgi:indole-3-glycerol phosphate synthase